MFVPPTIDVGPLLTGTTEAERLPLIDQLHRACTETGFLLAEGHGLDGELDAVFDAAKAFFDQSPADKERTPRIDRYGFVPHSGQAIDTSRASDRTEYLDMGLAADAGIIDRAPLPDIAGFEAAVRAYQERALDLGRALIDALTEALELPTGFFTDHMTTPQSRLRFLHYPPVEPAADGTLPVPTEPHTDYGLITLLATDGVPGLEVKPLGPDGAPGVWTPVPAERGQLVVNLGDMMARWTNDVYRSTPHRVVGPATGDRLSIPFFVNPDPGTVVDTAPSCISDARPRRYEPVTAGEFLARRIDGYDEPYVDRSEGPARRAEPGNTEGPARRVPAS